MVTHKDIQLRQAIWFEYRLGNGEQHALVNICKKLGTDSVSSSTITYWYELFRGKMFLHHISLFDKNTSQNKLTYVIQKLPNGDEVGKI
jgi:hypothetical protein